MRHSPNKIRRVSACGEGDPAQVARARVGEESISWKSSPACAVRALVGCKAYLVGEKVTSIKNFHIWRISHINDHDKKNDNTRFLTVREGSY